MVLSFPDFLTHVSGMATNKEHVSEGWHSIARKITDVHPLQLLRVISIVLTMAHVVKLLSRFCSS